MAESGYSTHIAQAPPVEDWATDFDQGHPDYNRNAYEIWEGLRTECPVAHTERYGGTWLPVNYDTVREISYDTDTFTSRQVIVNNLRTPKEDSPAGLAPPITSDPPFHKNARKLLLPEFRPNKIEPWEAEIRQICNDRLDDLGDITPGTIIDGATQYTQHIPVRVIARMLGFPEDDDEKFRKFIHDGIENISATAEEREEHRQQFDAYLDLQIDSHIENPREDLTSYLLNAELEGEKLSREHVRGTINLLLIAGIDTTWSAIGASIWHLAQNPDDRHRMIDDPDVMPFAIEEMLRAYAPVTMARLVAKDADFHGCPMKEDEWVLLPFPAANRDPAMFKDADKVIIDRQENRHSAFGLGIHRCLGSNLARMELQIGVEEFLKRFRDFELVDVDAVRWSLGQIRGPREMPIRIL